MNQPAHHQTELPAGHVWAISPYASGHKQIAHVYKWDKAHDRPVGLCRHCPAPFQMAFTQPGRLCLRCEKNLDAASA